MSYRILNAKTDADLIKKHLTHLTSSDLYNRFGCITNIDSYVEKIPTKDLLLGYIEGNSLIGFLQLCDYGEKVSEVALSVATEKRHKGIGTGLIKEALKYAKNKNIDKLFFHYYSTNNSIKMTLNKFKTSVAYKHKNEHGVYLSVKDNIPVETNIFDYYIDLYNNIFNNILNYNPYLKLFIK